MASGGAAWRIVAVGRIGRGAEAELFARYAARLRPAPIVDEVAEARGAPGEITAREATALLALVPARSRLVALDSGGEALDTASFAARLGFWRDRGEAACFVIGGAEGLHASVIARAADVISLGPLTWPHLLARVLLAEQLYRAQCIATGHPYHRAGRP